MNQANPLRDVSKFRSSAAKLACAFLVGSGLGSALGYWVAAFSGDFVQTGEIRPLKADTEVEIHYPRRYSSVPFLKIEEPIISYEMVDQTPQGFRIRIKNFYANFDKAMYTVKGAP